MLACGRITGHCVEVEKINNKYLPQFLCSTFYSVRIKLILKDTDILLPCCKKISQENTFVIILGHYFILKFEYL